MGLTMPQLMLDERKIRDSFKDLSVSTHNRQLYSELVGHTHVQDIAAEVGKPIPPGYRLIMVTTRKGTDKFEIALVNDYLEEVAYYNQVIIVPYTDLNCRPATQQLVWRSTNFAHSPALAGLPASVFFNFILKRYDVILSDNVQTGEGRHFWQRSMSEALARNLCVYHCQLMSTELTRIRDQEHLTAITDRLWGQTEEYRESLAIISCAPLPSGIVISPRA